MVLRTIKRRYNLLILLCCVLVTGVWILRVGIQSYPSPVLSVYKSMEFQRVGPIGSAAGEKSSDGLNDSKRRKLIQQISDADILIVGAGLSGSVLANLHASLFRKKVLIVEKRDHIAGNCYDRIDELGIRVSQYGPHLFHTKSEIVWNYLSQFTDWHHYEHRSIGLVDGILVPIPVSANTVNLLFNESLHSQAAMRAWLLRHQVINAQPQNGEQAAKTRVGEELYEKIFKHYTYKQWSKYPAELDAAVLQRIPVKDNFDDRYFPNDKYQALPRDGYTAMVSNMLNDTLISVSLNTDYFALESAGLFKSKTFEAVFFTGPIDRYFHRANMDKLEYRSINFETVHLRNRSFFQPNPIVNYPQGPEKFTRIVEYKHFYNQNVTGTTIVREYSTDSGDPYYPVLNERNRELYAEYTKLAEQEEKERNVHFVGRLANYKYFDMDAAVLNVLQRFDAIYPGSMKPFPKQPPSSRCDLSVVVSHCAEDLNWLNEIAAKYCDNDDGRETFVFIYEKCRSFVHGQQFAAAHPSCHVQQVPLPNVGRESHSWLHFMFTKQSVFCDVNVFLRGMKETPAESIAAAVSQLGKAVASPTPTYNSSNHEFLTHYKSLGILNCAKMTSYAELCPWTKKVLNACFNFKTWSEAGFTVTGDVLRRMLSRFRPLLVEFYDKINESERPEAARVLELMWSLLFRYPHVEKC